MTTQKYIYVDNLSKVFYNNSQLMRYTTKYNRFIGLHRMLAGIVVAAGMMQRVDEGLY